MQPTGSGSWASRGGAPGHAVQRSVIDSGPTGQGNPRQPLSRLSSSGSWSCPLPPTVTSLLRPCSGRPRRCQSKRGNSEACLGCNAGRIESEELCPPCHLEGQLRYAQHLELGRGNSASSASRYPHSEISASAACEPRRCVLPCTCHPNCHAADENHPNPTGENGLDSSVAITHITPALSETPTRPGGRAGRQAGRQRATEPASPAF